MAKKAIDWASIEKEFRVGQLSIRDIAKEHGIAEGTIRKHAKKFGWERDLTQRVQDRLRSKQLRKGLRTSNAQNQKEEDDLVEEAAERVLAVIETHQKGAKSLREFLREISDSVQGRVTNKSSFEDIKEASIVCRNVAQALDRLVGIERAAYNIDDTSQWARKILIELD